MKFISVRKKLTFIILTLIIICVFVLGTMFYINARNNYISSVISGNYKTLENVNEYFLKNFIIDMEHVINYWTETEEIKSYRNKPGQPKMVVSIPKHFEPIYHAWEGYIKSNPDMAWLYLGVAEDGSGFFAPLDPTMPQNYDSRKRDWYNDALKNEDKVIWTDPYLDAGSSGEILVTVAKAVKDKDYLVGVMGMDIKLRKFSNIINNIQYGENGYLVLLGQYGDVYAHPDTDMLNRNISNLDWVKKVFTGDSGADIYKWEGKDVIVSYLTVPETEWKLIGITNIDLKARLGNVKSQIILVAAISIIITFFIGYLLAKSISRPIDEVMNAIKEVSNNNLDVTVKINSNDEFKILGEKFNDMLRELKELLKERSLHINELTQKNIEIFSQKEEISAYSEETEAMNEELTNLLDQIRGNYLNTVRALANSIEASDKYTRGHCDRVCCYSMSIAEKLKLGTNEIINLEFASVLHDIGKIGISPAILNKEGKLTPEEFETIKQHPKIGFEILKDVPFLQDSRNILLQHHERIDGKGYPYGLKEDEINISAKIIMVADAFDAMTSVRPYRSVPLTEEESIGQLMLGKGSQFDERVVDAFVEVLTENK